MIGLLGPILLCSLGLASPQKQGPDIVKSTHVIRGRVVGFEVGDFEHVIILGPGKKEDSYFIGAHLLDDFLAANAKKPGRFTVQLVDTYIEQAGGRQTVERVSNAKFGTVSFGAWVKTQRRHLSEDQIDAKYQRVIQKLTKSE